MGGGALRCRRWITGEGLRGILGFRECHCSVGAGTGGGAPCAPGAPVLSCSHLADAHVARCCQPWAASLFAVFPAPRWSRVSTGERHRHSGPLGVRPRRPAGGAAGAGAIGHQIGVGLPGLRLVHRVFPARRVALGVLVGGVSWGGSGLSGSWFAGRLAVSAGRSTCFRRVGVVRVMAPAKGHPHQRMNRCGSGWPTARHCIDLQGAN